MSASQSPAPNPGSQPLISVVIPCYNTAATLVETLDSVARQTWTNLEIIAVDDQSRDTTVDVLVAYGANEPRLRIVGKKNAGCGAARNTGIAIASGAFIGLIDADDLWDPTYLARHMERFAADPTLGVSFTRVKFISPDGADTGEGTRPQYENIKAADILEANPCGCAMMVARRKVFREVGLFNHNLRRAEDQEWLFRVALTRWTIRGIPEFLADYRNSPAGLSANLDAQVQAYEDLLGHAHKVAPRVVDRARDRAMAGLLHYIARRALRLGESGANVRQYLWRGIKSSPLIVLRKPTATLGIVIASFAPGAVDVFKRVFGRGETAAPVKVAANLN
jgi:glycosyltransferase involved in cell wall biosynthesis